MLNACRRPNNLDRKPRYSGENRGRANYGVVVRKRVNCTVTGLYVNGVRHPGRRADRELRRLNVTNCTILDCDRVGMPLKDT